MLPSTLHNHILNKDGISSSYSHKARENRLTLKHSYHVLKVSLGTGADSFFLMTCSHGMSTIKSEPLEMCPISKTGVPECEKFKIHPSADSSVIYQST